MTRVNRKKKTSPGKEKPPLPQISKEAAVKGIQGLTQKCLPRGSKKTTATKYRHGQVCTIHHPFNPPDSIFRCRNRLKMWPKSQSPRAAHPSTKQSAFQSALSVTTLPGSSTTHAVKRRPAGKGYGPYLALLGVFQLRTIRDKIREILNKEKKGRRNLDQAPAYFGTQQTKEKDN